MVNMSDEMILMEKINANPEVRNVQAPPEIEEKIFSRIREYEQTKAGVIDEIIGKVDNSLCKLEEELLKERVASDPDLQNVEITPELREKLLKEIRDKYQELEE